LSYKAARPDKIGTHPQRSARARLFRNLGSMGGSGMEPLDRITVDPRICMGQPTIRGMRITVSVIVKMLAAGRSISEILEAYPELEEEDVDQVLKYTSFMPRD
jgi:uncharacterized protein (DUF433 family)